MMKNKKFADTAKRKIQSRNDKALVIFLLNNTRALAIEFDYHYNCEEMNKNSSSKININIENTVHDVIKLINTSN